MEGLENGLEALLVLAAELFTLLLENLLGQGPELQAQLIPGLFEQGQFLAAMSFFVGEQGLQLDNPHPLLDAVLLQIELLRPGLRQFRGKECKLPVPGPKPERRQDKERQEKAGGCQQNRRQGRIRDVPGKEAGDGRDELS